MSERRRRKQERRARRKAKRERSIKQMALVRVRALGCTCRTEPQLIVLPIGRGVYVQHERSCARWESIRRTDGSSLITGQLHPFVDLDDDEGRAA